MPESGMSIPALLNNLLEDLAKLIRQEVRLAKAETSEKVSQMKRGAVSIAIGGGLAFAGFLFLLLAATSALSLVLPVWGAALIVGAASLLIGLAFIRAGQSGTRGSNLIPQRTVTTLKDDAAWTRHPARGG